MGDGITGTAVAWRREIGGLLREYAAEGSLSFTEVIAENIHPHGVPTDLVALHEAGVTVVPHGVTLGLAGAELPAGERLERLAALAERFGSPIVSEHVAFVRAADTADTMHPEVLEAGHLLPPPRTAVSLDILAENISVAQAALPVPLAVENIAALFAWPEDEYDEADFLTELVARTGVRLVLDVANLYSSAVARGSDPAADLRRFPLDAVAYVHVAGGEFKDGLYVDTHGHPMPPPVLDLLDVLVAAYAGHPPGIMLERDTDVTEAAIRAEFDLLTAAVTKGVRPVG